PKPQAFPLQLDVEAQGNGLNVRWNPLSTAVATARGGRLVIADADQKVQTVDLGADQLRSGHIYYQSPSARLELRLEVEDLNGGLSRESVLALSAPPTDNRGARPPVVVKPIASPPAPVATPSAAAVKPPPRAFVAPKSSPSGPTQGRPLILDAPSTNLPQSVYA